MKEVTLDLGPRINDEKLNRLLTVLDAAGFEDEIKITIETSDAHEADDIFKVLDKRQFGYYTKGGIGDLYNIIASKKYLMVQ